MVLGSKIPPFTHKASEDKQGYWISTPGNCRIAVFGDRIRNENT
jgi:hypothetical protein